MNKKEILTIWDVEGEIIIVYAGPGDKILDV